MIEAPITRRNLLAVGGAALATAAVPGAARAASRPDWFDRDALEARVGETFVMREEGRSTALRLKSVRDLAGTTHRGRSLRGRSDAFVLTFKPVSSAPAGDATATFSHRKLGATQLFAMAGTATYTVIVNRSAPLGAGRRLSGAAVRMRRRRKRARRR